MSATDRWGPSPKTRGIFFTAFTSSLPFFGGYSEECESAALFAQRSTWTVETPRSTCRPLTHSENSPDAEVGNILRMRASECAVHPTCAAGSGGSSAKSGSVKTVFRLMCLSRKRASLRWNSSQVDSLE